MTFAVAAHLTEWKDKGFPTTPERREWAEAVWLTLCREATRLTDPVEEQEARQAKRPAISGSSYKGCARQLWFLNHEAERRPASPEAYLIWRLGYYMEAAEVRDCILSGLNVVTPGPDCKQGECVLTIDGREYRGHVDMEIVGDLPLYSGHNEIVAGYEAGNPLHVYEIKSLNGFTYDDWKYGKRIKGGGRGRPGPTNDWGYLSQVEFYALARQREGANVVGKSIIALSKLKGGRAQYRMNLDAKMGEEIIEAIRLAEGEVTPRRPEWATTDYKPKLNVDELSETRCKYCAVNEACWPGLEQTIMSSGPVYRIPRKEG